MGRLEPAGEERSVYSGKLFQVFVKPMRVDEKVFEFERVVRPPGTRLLIVQNGKILITKEYRTELEDYDYRLPGGKMFDTLTAYLEVRGDNEQLYAHAEAAAKKECLEEVGLQPTNLTRFYISRAGATIEWNLYYFVVDDFEKSEQNLEDGEEIEVGWYSFQEARKLCVEGKMQEDRSVGVLLRFLETRKISK